MELIFRATHEVLCFGFVAKTVLITHQCFGYCWRGFLFIPLFPFSKQARDEQEVGRRHSWDN